MTARPSQPLFPLLGLSAFIVTSIFYVFASGSPQPADFLLLSTILATVAFAWRRLPRDPALYIALAVFIAWIVLVNVTWFFIVPDFQFLRKTLFYLFNALLLLFVIATGNHDCQRLTKAIRYSCIVALLVQLCYISFVYVADGTRAVGTFNNPNQLAYWSVLVMTCLAVAKQRVPLRMLDLVALGVGYYLVMVSLSRAGLISSALLLLLVVAFCKFSRYSGFVLACLIGFGLVLEIGSGGLIERVRETGPVFNLEVRFDRTAVEADPISKRGYMRILEYPQYLIFGAGEGAFARFASGGDVKEFHSSLGTLFFSYGAVGLGLFCLFLFVVLARAPWSSLAYICPVMLYGVTHMGLRFSEFWILLGLVYSQARATNRKREFSRLLRCTGRSSATVGPRSWRSRRGNTLGASPAVSLVSTELGSKSQKRYQAVPLCSTSRLLRKSRKEA